MKIVQLIFCQFHQPFSPFEAQFKVIKIGENSLYLLLHRTKITFEWIQAGNILVHKKTPQTNTSIYI